MRRRSFYKAVLLMVMLFIVSLGIVGFLLKQEPEFYVRENANIVRADDSAQAGKVLTRLNELMEDMRTTQKGDWEASFQADELNAFFRERENNPLADLGDIPDQRIAIEDDRLRIAIRKGSGFFSTVVEVEVKLWLVKDQSNLMALEIVGFRAGALPLPKNWILDEISTAARRLNADVNWYRNGSNPVAICRLYSNQSRPETQLTNFRIGESTISIGGRHTGSPAQTQLVK